MEYDPQYADPIATIMAIEDEAVRSLDMHEEDAINEAHTLYEAVQRDDAALRAKGCPAEFIDSLLSRINLFAYIVNYILLKLHDDETIQEQWIREKRRGYTLRREIFRAFEVAYRNNKGRLEQLEKIRTGRGDTNMIIDLLSLDEMGKNYPDQLIAVNYDMTILQDGKDLSAHLSSLLGRCNIAPDEKKELREVRNRAYTWLHEAMEEIRVFGLWIHADDEEKRQNYISAFHSERAKNAAQARWDNRDAEESSAQ